MIVKPDEVFDDNIQFTIFKYTYNNFKQIQMHYHDFIEIAYVCNGKGIHILGDKRYEVSKGDLYIINFDTPHSFFPLDMKNSGNLIVFNCIFLPEFIESLNIQSNIFKEIVNIFLYKSIYSAELEYSPDLKIADDSINDINSLFERMYTEYSLKSDNYVDLLKIYLCELLLKIHRIYKTHGYLNSGKNNYCRQQLIYDAINFLRENHSSKLNLKEISHYFFMSKSYFSLMFKKATGMSVIEYVQNLRIEKACRMLVESDEKVTNIAESIGYTDYGFFNRTFKKITGLTAQEYRIKYRNQIANGQVKHS